MSATRWFPVLVACACLGSVVAWADPVGSSPTVTPTKLVKFNSFVHETIHDGHATGVFTIQCKPRAGVDMHKPVWVAQCNQLGHAAIEKAVSQGLIEPVEGVVFLDPSRIPANSALQSLSFSRNIPLTNKSSI